MNSQAKARAARHAKDSGLLSDLNGSLAETSKRVGEIKRTVDEVAEDNMALLEAVRRAAEGQESFRASVVQEMDMLRAGLAGELVFHSLRNCCRELAPVVSALERMLAGADFSDAESIRQHVGSFAAGMEGVLKRMGMERIAVSVGTDQFDGRIHECVRVCTPADSPLPDAPPKTIVRVDEHGYLVQGRLAMAAKVWVQALEAAEAKVTNGGV